MVRERGEEQSLAGSRAVGGVARLAQAGRVVDVATDFLRYLRASLTILEANTPREGRGSGVATHADAGGELSTSRDE